MLIFLVLNCALFVLEQINAKSDIISQLRKDILQWEGYKPPLVGVKTLIGLGSIEVVFPNEVFPLAGSSPEMP